MSEAMSRVDMLKPFSAKGFFKIFFAESIDTVACKFFRAKIVHENMNISRLIHKLMSPICQKIVKCGKIRAR